MKKIMIKDKNTKKSSEPKYLDEAFEQVCAEMVATFLKKHKDYGKGNIISIKELGISFRITEKAERLKNLLMSNDNPQNETKHDSWIDIGVYAVIGILYSKGWFEKLEVRPDKK